MKKRFKKIIVTFEIYLKNKIMKKIVLSMLLGLASLPIFSQANNAAYDFYARTIDINQKSLAFGLTEAEFKDVEGSPYATPEFVSGVIYQDSKVVQPNVQLRYNVHADEIEIKSMGNSGEESFSALLKDPNIYAKIFKDMYIFVPFEGSVEKGGYFNIVTQGEHYDLYKKTTSVFSPPTKARTTYEKDRRASFKQIDTYYLVSKKGDFYELPNTKSKILKVMDKKKSEVKEYISDNRLNLNNEADLEKLVTYFNSIL